MKYYFRRHLILTVRNLLWYLIFVHSFIPGFNPPPLLRIPRLKHQTFILRITSERNRSSCSNCGDVFFKKQYLVKTLQFCYIVIVYKN